jgi:hypothetical protein
MSGIRNDGQHARSYLLPLFTWLGYKCCWDSHELNRSLLSQSDPTPSEEYHQAHHHEMVTLYVHCPLPHCIVSR